MNLRSITVLLVACIIAYVDALSSILAILGVSRLESKLCIAIVLFLMLIIIVLIYYRNHKKTLGDIGQLNYDEKENALKSILERCIYDLDIKTFVCDPIEAEYNELDNEQKRLQCASISQRKINKKLKNKYRKLFYKAEYFNGILMRLDQYELALEFGRTFIKIGKAIDNIGSTHDKIRKYKIRKYKIRKYKIRKCKIGKYESIGCINQAWNYIKSATKNYGDGKSEILKRSTDNDLKQAKALLIKADLDVVDMEIRCKAYRHFFVLYRYMLQYESSQKYFNQMKMIINEMYKKSTKGYVILTIYDFILNNINVNKKTEIKDSTVADLIRDNYKLTYQKCKAGMLNAEITFKISTVLNSENVLNNDALIACEKKCRELKELYETLDDYSRMAKACLHLGNLHQKVTEAVMPSMDMRLIYYRKADKAYQDAAVFSKDSLRIDIQEKVLYAHTKLLNDIEEKSLLNDVFKGEENVRKRIDSIYAEAISIARKTNSGIHVKRISQMVPFYNFTILFACKTESNDGKEQISKKDEQYLKYQAERINEFYSGKVPLLTIYSAENNSQISANKLKEYISGSVVEALKELEGLDLGNLEAEKQATTKDNVENDGYDTYCKWRSGKINISSVKISNMEKIDQFKERMEDAFLKIKAKMKEDGKKHHIVVVCSYSVFLYFLYKFRDTDIKSKLYKKINLGEGNMMTFSLLRESETREPLEDLSDNIVMKTMGI